MAAGRIHLSKLSLADFAVTSPGAFKKRLDQETHRLQAALDGAGSFGLARKLLNIFLRDALYTTYVAEWFQLEKTEHLLEIPLDGIVAKKLRESDPRNLPRWLGVKHLTPEASAAYQEAAAKCAAKQNLARVDLDTYWWGLRWGASFSTLACGRTPLSKHETPIGSVNF